MLLGLKERRSLHTLHDARRTLSSVGNQSCDPWQGPESQTCARERSLRGPEEDRLGWGGVLCALKPAQPWECTQAPLGTEKWWE